MMSIRKLVRLLAVGVLAAGTMVAQAEAVPVLSISPASQIKTVGDSVSFDILISGIDTATPDPIAGFDITLTFNAAVLNLGVSSVLPGGGMGVTPLILDDSFGAGTYTVAVLEADIGSTAASLSALQGGGFTIATLTFNALAAGFSALTLAVNGGGLTDFDGNNVIASTLENGDVTVNQPGPPPGPPPPGPAPPPPPPVPEPATLLLLGTGLAMLGARRRMRRQ